MADLGGCRFEKTFLSRREDVTSNTINSWPREMESLENYYAESISPRSTVIQDILEPSSLKRSPCKAMVGESLSEFGAYSMQKTLRPVRNMQLMSDTTKTKWRSRPATEGLGSAVYTSRSPEGASPPPNSPHGPWKDRSPQTLGFSFSFRESPSKWILGSPRDPSPDYRLEKLKEKIRAQKHQGPNLSWTPNPSPSCLTGRSPGKQPLKKKVRKVAFAPPPPVYRGFSAVKLKPKCCAEGEVENWNVGIYGTCGSRTQTSGPREKIKAVKSHHAVHTKGSPRSSALGRTLKDQDVNSIGTSAWRKGQELAKFLLGPLPTFPQLECLLPAEDRVLEKESEKVERVLTTEQMPTSSQVPQSPTVDRPASRGRMVPEDPPGLLQSARNVLPRNAQQVLGDLLLLKPAGAGSGRVQPSIPKGPPEGLVGEPIQSCRPQPSAMRIDLSEGRGRFPKGGKAQWKKCWKENILQPPNKRINRGPTHRYTREEVQEFMNQQIAQRKRKHLEEKKSLLKALELRSRRLQEVYKKQKEAFSRKTKSGTPKRATKEDCAWKLPAEPQRSIAREIGNSSEKKALKGAVLTAGVLSEKEAPEDSFLQYLSKALTDTKTNEILEKGLGCPSSPLSGNGTHGPLKLQDLSISCSQAQHSSPQSLPPWLSNMNAAHKSTSLGDPTSFLLFQNKRARVQALHATAEELGERIEMASEQLNFPATSGTATGQSGRWAIPPDTSTSPKKEPLEEVISTTVMANGSRRGNPTQKGPWVSGEQTSITTASFEGNEGRAAWRGGRDSVEMKRRTRAPFSCSPLVGEELTWNFDSEKQQSVHCGKDLKHKSEGRTLG
uniref:Coiled-coil domain containing 187 n=1 Tax=Ornithorhynchus anatinus TaxID=9258 RepID=A0A6I8PNM7_ORNAN